MRNAQDILDSTFLEMRWRTLSLAADLDRVQRGSGGASVLKSDPRLEKLRRALAAVSGDSPQRAEKVQMIFSDMTPPPEYKNKAR